MAKKDHSLDVTKVNPLAVPEFMRGDETKGTEALAEFVIPPRIKVVQKQSRQELLDLFGPGDVILAPSNVPILELTRLPKGGIDTEGPMSFNIVPLFFYPEWATWNPIELRGQESAIRYRTTDPTDPIVSKARNANLREEPHPDDGQLKIRHVEHLNYIVMLVGSALEGTPALLSFAKGEWQAGSNFASLIKMRKAPLFGCVFTATVALRPGKLGQWYGLDISNPSDVKPWVDPEQYAAFNELHDEFTEHARKMRLKADLVDDNEEITDTAEF